MNDIKHAYTTKNDIDSLFNYLDVDVLKKETVFIISFRESKRREAIEAINKKMTIKRIIFLNIDGVFCSAGIVTDLKNYDVSFKSEIKAGLVLHKLHVNKQGILNNMLQKIDLDYINSFFKDLEKNRFGKDLKIIKRIFSETLDTKKYAYLIEGKKEAYFFVSVHEKDRVKASFFSSKKESYIFAQYNLFDIAKDLKVSTEMKSEKIRLRNEFRAFFFNSIIFFNDYDKLKFF